MSCVLLTDYPWPNLDIEREIIEAAGYRLVAGPSTASGAAAIEALVAEHDPEAIMTCWSTVSAAAIAKPTALKIVARMGVGLDNIAMDAATRRGAWVTNVPDYCVEEVSDHAIAMVLNHFRGIMAFDREVKHGRWDPASARLRRIATLTVGIIGFGQIGRVTARKLAQGFGCRVLVHSPSLLAQHGDGAEISENVSVADLAGLRENADAIILHVPLTQATHHMIDAGFIGGCRQRPLLVNVSRGGLVDNAALLRALQSRALSGAALDVVEGEPAPPREVVDRSDVVVTPHVAFSSDASLAELRRRCTEDVVRALRGSRPLHACNQPDAGITSN